jgi:hypothetical protein
VVNKVESAADIKAFAREIVDTILQNKGDDRGEGSRAEPVRRGAA